jgi:hypothetical protein
LNVDELIATLPRDAHFPDSLRARLRPVARAEVDALVAFVTGSSGDDDARAHAVDLLADVGAVASVPPLLELIADWDCPEVLWSHLDRALPRFGAAIIEPALALLARAPKTIARDSVCSVLAAQGTRDPRVFAALCAAFADDAAAATHFVTYGDPKALEILRDAVVSFAPDITEPWAVGKIDDMTIAIERLGGAIDETLRPHVERCNRRAIASRIAFARTRPLFPDEIVDDDAYRAAFRENVPPLDLVHYAEPLFALCNDFDGAALSDAIGVAETLERVALLAEGAKREALLAGVLAHVDEGTELHRIIATMVSRYDAMFPDRRTNARRAPGAS